MSNIKRLFFATPIKSDIITGELLPELKKLLINESIAWCKENQLHLTYKFLGDTSIKNIQSLEKIFSNATSKISQYQIKLKTLKMFGSRYKPQVIWVGIEDNGETKKLHNYIQEELNIVGIKASSQNFVPHITIGRIRKLNDKDFFQSILKKYENFEAESINVENCILYESQLTNKGAIHIAVKAYSLGMIENR